jgi:hypothetical protein
MSTQQDAKDKISAAASGCAAAEKEWRAAAADIGGSINTNGYGVHHDQHQLRYKLLDAQRHIQKALRLLDGIEWPRPADYDAAGGGS